MQKQLLIDSINQQTEMDTDLKQEIMDFVVPFPEELSAEDTKRIDDYLAAVEEEESDMVFVAQSLIDENQNIISGLEHAKSEYITSTARDLRTGISQMQSPDDGQVNQNSS